MVGAHRPAGVVLRTQPADPRPVFRYETDGTATLVARYDRAGLEAFGLGSTVPLNPYSAIGRVRTTGAPGRIDDYTGIRGEVAGLMKLVGLRSTVTAPIVAGGKIWEPSPSPGQRGAFPGLVRLRDRVEAVGGSLAVNSPPGDGRRANGSAWVRRVSWGRGARWR